MIHWIKVKFKIFVTKNYISNICFTFELCSIVSTRLLSSQKIMNDHMTQKTDIMTAENSGLPQK